MSPWAKKHFSFTVLITADEVLSPKTLDLTSSKASGLRAEALSSKTSDDCDRVSDTGRASESEAAFK